MRSSLISGDIFVHTFCQESGIGYFLIDEITNCLARSANNMVPIWKAVVILARAERLQANKAYVLGIVCY